MRNEEKQENMAAGLQKRGIFNALKGEQRMSRRTALGLGVGTAVLATGLGTFLDVRTTQTLATPVNNTVVVQWNSAACQAIAATGTGPTIGARALAIVHTSMYDAWTTYDTVAVPTRSNGIPKQSRRDSKAITESVSYAAYTSLVDLFPTQVSSFNALMNTLGYDPTDTSTDPGSLSGIGNVAAQAVLAYRHHDGSNQLGDLHPGAYSDYSGYTPTLGNPDHWQPLVVNGTPQRFLTPFWGQVTPFALSSGSQFRPAGPVTTANATAFKAQVDVILSYSAGLGDTNKVIAEYWSDGPHTQTPPGHWDLLSQFVSAQYVSRQNKHDISGDIKMFFALTNAIFDASIACWECKRFYDSVRPITAVHNVYTGTQVSAWGGPDKGTQSMDGSQFRSYLATPAFAEYVSGHSTFSATGASILAQVVGSDTFGDSYTAPAGSSLVEPGITPARAVTLSWPTFSSAAIQAGLSRQYGGIHFSKADQDGRALGQQVAPRAWAKAQTYITGTASS
jgi:hypothetical protein